MDISSLARKLGRRGGETRAKRLSAKRRHEIASQGGRSRARSLALAKRVRVNFRYVEAILALRGKKITVQRVKNFTGKLPGLYVK